MTSLANYLHIFQTLNVNRAGGRVSPHKPCMLLAMLGLADAGLLEKNMIKFEPALLERYARVFGAVCEPGDRLNPYFPFFHLRGDGFWHHQAIPGREAVLAAMTTARSMSAISDNIAYAYVSEDLHALIQDPPARASLREHLIVAWFGSRRMDIERVLQEEQASDVYESTLRRTATALVAQSAPVEPPTRDAAYRRVVNERYDYRCAASGWRIVLPQGAMVEAAHIIPFSESHDDDPRNGIALTPSYHWAFDAGIISPGPDYKWHVSRTVDARIADNRPLLELDAKDLLMPADRRDWPRKDALEWRLRYFDLD